MQGEQGDIVLPRLAQGSGRVHRLGRVVFWMLVIADVMFASVRLVLSVL